jgi:hypothetical protein
MNAVIVADLAAGYSLKDKTGRSNVLMIYMKALNAASP